MKKISQLILLAAFMAATFSYAQSSKPQKLPEASVKSARDMATTVNDNLGSAQKISDNAITPLTSDAKMKTLDGSEEFNANYMCTSENAFADITIVPLGNSNIRILNLRLDTNQDGRLDSYQTPNWEMTGICANGFINCSDPLNSRTCNYYKWEASSFRLSTSEVPVTGVGGCYCINNRCGNNLAMKNIETVLRDISSGIASALIKSSPMYALTNIKIDGTRAELFGSSTGRCDVAKLNSVTGSATANSALSSDYKRNPNKLANDGFSAKNSNPLARKIESTSVDIGHKVQSCSINRIVREEKVSMDDIITFETGTGSLYPIDDNKLRLVMGRIGNNYWSGRCDYFTLETNFFVLRPDRIKKASLSNAQYDDWMQVHIFQDGGWAHVWNGPYGTWTSATDPVPGNCELGTNWNQTLNVDFTHLFKTAGSKRFRSRVEVSGDGEGYLLGEIEIDTDCKVIPDEIVDNCQSMRNSSQCTLVEELVNGVLTFSNGYSTGLIPLPDNAGTFCGVEEIRDWTRKELTYRCESNFDYSFEKGFDRVAYVKSKSTIDKWYDKATDYDTGTVSYGDGDFPHYGEFGAMQCTSTCKTQKSALIDEITTGGVVAKKHHNTNTVDHFYYPCVGENSNICPAGPGERVVKACQCLNEFTEATVVMQALRLAGQDMICTNGERKMPDGTDKPND